MAGDNQRYDWDDVQGQTPFNRVGGTKHLSDIGLSGSHSKSFDTVERFNAMVDEHKQRLGMIDPSLSRDITVIAASLAEWVHTPENVKDGDGQIAGKERALVRQAEQVLKRAQTHETEYPGAVNTVQHVLETFSAASGLDLLNGKYPQTDSGKAAYALKDHLDRLVTDAVTPWGTPTQSVPRNYVEHVLKNTSSILAGREYYRQFPDYNEEGFKRTIRHSCAFAVTVNHGEAIQEATRTLLQRMGEASGVDLLALQHNHAAAVKDSKANAPNTGTPG